jgi:LmbE family N-acetylglucosaminyl deacetylase
MGAAIRIAALFPRKAVHAVSLSLVTAMLLVTPDHAWAQAPGRTLVAVLAHADDETPVGPILARYAREGAAVHVIVVTDGAQGGANTSIPRGPELARVRAEEARCASNALAIHPPILLGFPDGKLGDYTADPSLLYRLAPRLAEVLDSLRPDAVITWGPDGGTGHPDHRLVHNIVLQLARAGAPGATERIFFMYIPDEGMRSMNPQRGAPPLLTPQPRYASVAVAFTPADLDAGRRAMECHQTQFTQETIARVFPVMSQSWNGRIQLVPIFPTEREVSDIFR